MNVVIFLLDPIPAAQIRVTRPGDPSLDEWNRRESRHAQEVTTDEHLVPLLQPVQNCNVNLDISRTVPIHIDPAVFSNMASFDRIKTLLAPGPEAQTPDPTIAVLTVFYEDLISYFELVTDSLETIRRSTLDSIKVQQNVSQWKLLLTRFRYEISIIEKQLTNFVQAVHVETVLSLTKLHQDMKGDLHSQPSSQLASNALKRLKDMTEQINRSYADLQSEVSIIDSQRSIQEAESVSKLTELAFVFIPLTFAASIFGMEVKELSDPAPLYAFVLTSLGFVAIAYWARLTIRSDGIRRRQRSILERARIHANIRPGDPLSTRAFLRWAAPELWTVALNAINSLTDLVSQGTPWLLLLVIAAALVSPLVLLWQTKVNRGFATVVTLSILVPELPLMWTIIQLFLGHQDNDWKDASFERRDVSRKRIWPWSRRRDVSAIAAPVDDLYLEEADMVRAQSRMVSVVPPAPDELDHNLAESRGA